MSKYYVADNVVISFAGNVTEKQALKLVEKYFISQFKNKKSAKQKKSKKQQKRWNTSRNVIRHLRQN